MAGLTCTTQRPRRTTIPQKWPDVSASTPPTTNQSGRPRAAPLAARFGQKEAIWQLLAASAPIDARDNDGLTTLCLCAHYDEKLIVINRLIDRGADIEAKDNS
ncbi:MAG: hypothetical protein MMC23_009228 [Stictis urceolatum]|nr:hypothetical protein [Stictis urceolata]